MSNGHCGELVALDAGALVQPDQRVAYDGRHVVDAVTVDPVQLVAGYLVVFDFAGLSDC